jgi:hypothetical protein
MTDLPGLRFDWTVGDDPSAIPLDCDPRAVFGRARAPVVVEVGGHSYRSTVAIMGGRAFVPLRASHRAAAGVVSGATVPVSLTLDTAPREILPPDTLAAALAAAGVRPAWDALSYTARREDAEAVSGAVRAETRARRIAAIIARLTG